jgi:tRNA-dihydrouridine synthase B
LPAPAVARRARRSSSTSDHCVLRRGHRLRTARKHLGWYTAGLAGGEEFRREINAAESTGAQLSAVRRLFDRLALHGERLDYRPAGAQIVDARTVFGPARREPLRGGEALAA